MIDTVDTVGHAIIKPLYLRDDRYLDEPATDATRAK
jgi:hypothetical protein